MQQKNVAIRPVNLLDGNLYVVFYSVARSFRLYCEIVRVKIETRDMTGYRAGPIIVPNLWPPNALIRPKRSLIVLT